MHKLYTVIDRVAQSTFGNTIKCTNDEVARRSFHDALNDPKGPFAGHQQDYDLLLVAHIDDSTGAVEGCETPQLVARGADWLNANKEGTK